MTLPVHPIRTAGLVAALLLAPVLAQADGGPSASAQTQAAIEAQLQMAARPDTAERIATFKKQLYDALLAKGFTQQQAVNIVVATPLPSGHGPR